MNYSRFFVITSVAISALLFWGACSGKETKKSETSPQTWTGNMQGMADSLKSLLPLALNRSAFNDYKNRDKIDRQVAQLAEQSKHVEHVSHSSFNDPSLSLISTAFSEDLIRINESLKEGRREYARYGLVHVTSYCIECHTRTARGPRFTSVELDSSISSLNSFEKGEYLLATRQFEPAVTEFKKYISDVLKAEKNYDQLEVAVNHALAATVGYLRETGKTQEIIDILLQSDNTPYYLKLKAMAWNNAVNDWRRMAGKLPSKTSQRIAWAEKLINNPEPNEIHYLRALSELNLLLAGDLGKEDLGKSLYLAGTCYEALKEESIWNLHENFYESCIRRVPHTSWSKKCYAKLEGSIYFGYTGSRGTNIPPEEKRRLNQLKQLAF